MARSDEIIKKASDFLSKDAAQKEADRTQLERERRELVGSIGKDVAEMLIPSLENLVKVSRVTAEQMKELLREIKVDAPVIPEIKLPLINVPRPNVVVNTPNIPAPIVNIPATQFPEMNFPEQMAVTLNGVDRERPLPMLMVDVKGNPVQMQSAVGGGGKADFLTIKDIRGSTASLIDQIDGALRVTGSFSASLSLDYGSGEVGTATPRFVQATNAISSVAVKEIFGSTITDSVLNGDNRIRVSLETGGSGLTDSELRASSVPVEQVSGSSWSTAVTQVFGSTASDVVSPDGRLKVVLPSSILQVITYGFDGSGNPALAASASGVLQVGQVSGANWSVSVTNAVTSMISVGDLESDAADTGSAPVKVGGIARTANPTAVAAGDRVSSTHDDLGRQVVRPMQVRDLTRTAYVSLSNGTETTLLAASAGSYHDLIYVMGANQSDAAVTLDIRAVTAGNIMMSLQIPASGTAGVALPVPLPQDETGNNWTIDMDDITGTTVDVSALFSREV